ncbi:hypothetical protein Q7P37_004330 [Cladosporium fusiforme]
MAASSSVGSDVFAILSLLVISTLVLLLLRHYLPLRTTPGYLLVPVFLALALPCSIILLVPIDLASTENADSEGPKRGIWLPERAVFVAWRITYWLTFVLTWFILPLMGEYCDSGFRDTRGRILHSLRSNARYQLIVLSTAIAGLVYFILQNGFHGESIKGLVMALAYAWGLVLAIGLMGHGLVAMPRRLFRNASPSERLRRLQTQAPKTKDKLDDAIEQLEVLENTAMQLKSRKSGTSLDTQDWIDELAETSSIPDSRPGAHAAIRATSSTIPGVITKRYLADFTRKLKRARHRRARFVDEWAHLCQQAQDTQMVIDSATSKKLDFGRERPNLLNFKILTPNLRFYLHFYTIPYLRIALSLFFAAASVLVVWSEVVSSFSSKLSIIGLTVVHHPNSDRGQVPFFGQIVAAAWLLYMDACALYAISDVKVWGNRALVKRQTYAESACWYSLQVAKLTVPLSFNFITLMPASVYKETSFFHFLGKLVNLTPLGSGFSTYFPCFILVPALATLFNLYGKTKKIIGFGVLEDDSEENPSGFGTGGWREGRALIDREVQSRGEGSAVGLSPRGASLDLERGALSGTSTPARGSQQAPLLPSQANPEHRTREANRQFNSITNQEEEREDDSARHFYQDFTERVKNTFETTDRPEWMQNLGKGITMPTWMNNDDRDSDGGSALKRWFGGRAEDGRLRL